MIVRLSIVSTALLVGCGSTVHFPTADQLGFSQESLVRKHEQYLYHLEQFHEGPIDRMYPGVDEAYRFLHFPELMTPSLVVITRHGDQYALHGKVMKGANWQNNERWTIGRQGGRSLMKEEWETFLTKFRATEFWTAKYRGCDNCLDGEHFFFEAYTHSSHRVASVHRPYDDTPQGAAFVEACLFLHDLAGLTFSYYKRGT